MAIRDDTASAERYDEILSEARESLSRSDIAEFLLNIRRARLADPDRCEAYREAATFFRDRGDYGAAIAYAGDGLARIATSADPRGTGPCAIGATGLIEEYSIAANHASDARVWSRGRAFCEWLAFGAHADAAARALATHNAVWYVAAAETLFPSIAYKELTLQVPDTFRPMNTSLCICDGRLLANVSCVNYTLLPGTLYSTTNGNGPVRNLNYLVELDADLNIVESRDVLPAADMPPPLTDNYFGFGDPRLFEWKGALWGIASSRQFEASGHDRMVLYRLGEDEDGWRMQDWRVLPSYQAREKNWMPLRTGDDLFFVYRTGPFQLLNQDGVLVRETQLPIDLRAMSGNSQLIPFETGWLCVVHQFIQTNGERRYAHRFLWVSEGYDDARLSAPFFLRNRRVDFVCGLAWHPDGVRLIVTFGAHDSQAWSATVDAAEVATALSGREALARRRDREIAALRDETDAAPRLSSGTPDADAARARIRLVDVGGAGGLQDKWAPYSQHVAPIFFEPDTSEADQLRNRYAASEGSVVLEVGLSNTTGEKTLYVAHGRACSSLLRPNHDVLKQYDIDFAFATVAQAQVQCSRYDDLYHHGRVPAPDVIKIDVQGHEHEVLLGFGGLLDKCLAIELESHFYPIYKDQKLLHDLVELLAAYDFVLRKVEPVPNFDGDLVEINAFFTKKRSAWRTMKQDEREKFAVICEVWGLPHYR